MRMRQRVLCPSNLICARDVLLPVITATGRMAAVKKTARRHGVNPSEARENSARNNEKLPHTDGCAVQSVGLD